MDKNLLKWLELSNELIHLIDLMQGKSENFGDKLHNEDFCIFKLIKKLLHNLYINESNIKNLIVAQRDVQLTRRFINLTNAAMNLMNNMISHIIAKLSSCE